MGTNKIGLKRNREEEGNAKTKAKRGRLEEASSQGSSTHPTTMGKNNMKQWKGGRYIPTFLNLLMEVRNGPKSLDGPLWSNKFWESFTTELNKRVGNEMSERRRAKFRGFAMEDVKEYAADLMKEYEDHVKIGGIIPNHLFPLYDGAFGICNRCAKRPKILRSHSKSGPSCSTPSKRSRDTCSSKERREEEAQLTRQALDAVTNLVSKRKLPLDKLGDAIVYLYENSEIRYIWSNLTEEDQARYLQIHV